MLRPAIGIESLRHLRAPASPGCGARVDPRLFGRRFPGFILGESEELGWMVGEDLKLFATTFAVGFLFVSVLIF
jgi:hypothetical protein